MKKQDSVNASDEIPRFGRPEPGVQYRYRRAAYIVILDSDRRVALVRTQAGLFLPGGGSLSNESPQETVRRELLEECGRPVRIHQKLGEAMQFFQTERANFEMFAVFYSGAFSGPVEGPAEHELVWAETPSGLDDLFHECQRWAVQQALAV
ncbi:MAG: NUDIX domain-containing protein [bacterium]